MKLTIEHLSCYLPYGLKIKFGEIICTMSGISGSTMYTNVGHALCYAPTQPFPQVIFPLVRPLSDLTREIEHNGERLVFTELFEIGDNGGYNFEFDHGNIKLIERLKTISKYNCHNDIKYLPYPVVQEMIKYHFEIEPLLDNNLALPITN